MAHQIGEQKPNHLRKVLRTEPEHRLKRAELLARLRESFPKDEWNDELLDRAIAWCRDRHRNPRRGHSDWDIDAEPGGRTIYFVPSRGSAGVGKGVVGQIVRKLEGRPLQKRAHELFGVTAGHITAVETAHASHSRGRWSTPDIVVNFYRSPSSSTRLETHAIEVEERSGKALKASPQQVAQAFVAGRGADRVWLMFHEADLDRLSTEEDERFNWTAKELGVGLLVFRDAGNINTWKQIQRARPIQAGERYRRDLLQLIQKVG